MSFEFERPTGFSPCGAAMGVIRVNHCYSAPVKTFADGEQDNRIIWYKVPDDRPFYTEMHTFFPRVDDMFDPPNEYYEKCGHIPCPRKHYSGRDIWFRAGDHVHGDAQDFLGESLHDKYMVGGHGPFNPCAEPQHLFAEVGLGVRKHNLPLAVEFSPIGFSLGVIGSVGAVEGRSMGIAFGLNRVPPTERSPAGFALGIVGRAVAAVPFILANGLALAAVGTNVDNKVQRKPIGLALGIVGQNITVPDAAWRNGIGFGVVKHESPPATELLAAHLLLGIRGSASPVDTKRNGLAFGIVGRNVAAVTETRAAGFLLGTVGHNVSAPVQEQKAGFTLGVIGTNSDHVTQTKKLGISLGVVGHAVTAPIVPGSSCATSGLLPLSTPITRVMSAGTYQEWWKFPCTAGTQYTVTIHKNSGPYPANGIQHGDCALPTLDGSCTLSVETFVFTPGATTANVHVNAPTSFVTNYTITVTSP